MIYANWTEPASPPSTPEYTVCLYYGHNVSGALLLSHYRGELQVMA